MDCSPLGFSVHGIFQARILEQVIIPFSRDLLTQGSSNPGIKPRSLALQADSLPTEPPGKPNNKGKERKKSEVAQWCPTLCYPVDCSLPGSSVHGIFQARVLEWVAISFSRESSQPRDRTWVSRIAGSKLQNLLSEPPQGGVCNSSKVNDKHCKMCVFQSSAPLGRRTRELRLFFLVSDSLVTTGSDQSLKREEQERGRQGRQAGRNL